jgi:hypothetical protein
MDTDSFRDLVYQTSLSLTSSEVHGLSYLYGLPQMSSCNGPIEVLIQLEVNHIIYANNPESLAVVYERIKRKDLAKQVRNACKKMSKSAGHLHAADSHITKETNIQMEIAMIRMQMGYAADGMKALKLKLKGSRSLSEIDKAIVNCSNTQAHLTAMQNMIDKEEDVNPSSTTTSNDQIPPVPSKIKKHLSGAVSVLPILPQGPPQMRRKDDTFDDETGSGGDSGFADAKLFRKKSYSTSHIKKTTAAAPQYDAETTTVYMKLITKDVAGDNEYAPLTNYQRGVCPSHHDEDDYSEVKFTT